MSIKAYQPYITSHKLLMSWYIITLETYMTQQIDLHYTYVRYQNITSHYLLDIIYLDATKAFDTVSYSLLLHKLCMFTIGGKLWS